MKKVRFPVKMGVLLISVLLVGCVTHTHEFVQTQVQQDKLQENWQRQVDTDPAQWKKQADDWLWFGAPTRTELADREAPFSAAMSTMMVRVPDFTKIKVNGAFQVQLDGRFQHNSVYLLGPNEELRQVVVEVKDQTLDIHRVDDKNKDPQHVIVRIAIHNLQSLTQGGSGKVEGRFIRANPLSLHSTGSGAVVLAGKINVKHIEQSGAGDITLLGAYTPFLKLESSGRGAVNISGRVGIASLVHTGSGDVNIIGADTNALEITAAGAGKIGIRGVANLQQVTASGDVKVYLYFVKSKNLYVYLRDKATVGLAGDTKSLYVDARNSALFAGRYLYSQYTYVRAREWAHINAGADDRAFAAADDNSSVYIIGRPQVISPYVNDNAVIIPIEPPPRTASQELRVEKKKAGRFGTETYLP
jgi:hypothetical protein